MSCNTEDGTMTGTGEITYAGQGYRGTMTLLGKAGGDAINVTQKYSAKRVGDCN